MSALSFCQPGSLYLWEEKPSISEYQFQMKGSLMILDYCSYIVSTQVPLCLIDGIYLCCKCRELDGLLVEQCTVDTDTSTGQSVPAVLGN